MWMWREPASERRRRFFLNFLFAPMRSAGGWSGRIRRARFRALRLRAEAVLDLRYAGRRGLRIRRPEAYMPRRSYVQTRGLGKRARDVPGPLRTEAAREGVPGRSRNFSRRVSTGERRVAPEWRRWRRERSLRLSHTIPS